MTTTSANLWIHGRHGRMGQAITRLVSNEQGCSLKLAGGWDSSRPIQPADLESLHGTHTIVDFSAVEASQHLLEVLEQVNIPPSCSLRILVGTTGQADDVMERWRRLPQIQHNIGVLVAPNTSLGIYWLGRLAGTLAAPLTAEGFDIEMVESHHRHKKDAPSGTAKFLLESLLQKLPSQNVRPRSHYDTPREPGDIGVHALRGGGVFGEHEIRFLSDEEEIVILHRARSRDLFARGAVTLGRWLSSQKAAYYHLRDVTM